MVKWRINTKPQPKLLGYYMHDQPSQSYMAIIYLFTLKTLRDATFSTEKKEMQL